MSLPGESVLGLYLLHRSMMSTAGYSLAGYSTQTPLTASLRVMYYVCTAEPR